MPRFRSSSIQRAAGQAGARLSELEDFGSNPGNLKARIYVPPGAAGSCPLVVVLHGCTQTAAGYDAAAGWSQLADEQGFILLYPEQQRANNPNLCFNWFSPAHIRRDEGEALSIRQMIAAVVRDYPIDESRVFVTGLSAGGAMTSVMLAVYPEVFAGGAIIAGLPYGTAHGVPRALERMRGQGMPEASELTSLVRAATSHGGAWPSISVWHGSADATVHRSNADAILSQWQSVHGVSTVSPSEDVIDGYPHKTWADAEGNIVIESYDITSMGHGTPLSTKGGDGCGESAPFMLEVGISSTRRIAGFWGLARSPRKANARSAPETNTPNDIVEPVANVPVLRTVRAERIHEAVSKPKPNSSNVGQIIEDALRAAGLMR